MNELTKGNTAISSQERDIKTVTNEIKMLRRQAQAMALTYSVEIGRRLVEAKEMLPYGEWGNWLKTEVEFSQDTANRFMKLFEEYGSAQISLFGAEVDSAALRNLSFTKALRLLAIPADEREEFAQENDIENLSTRELDKLIKERDEALKAKEEAERLKAIAVKEVEEYKEQYKAEWEKNDEIGWRIEELEEELATLKERPVDVAVQEPDEETLKKAVEEALADAKANYEKEQKKLKDKLEGLEKKRDKLEQDLKIAEEAKESAETQLKAYEVTFEGAAAEEAKVIDLEKEKLSVEIAELRKKLAMSDSGVTAFQTLYNEAQAMFNRLIDNLKKIENPDTKDKLRAGTAKLLEVFSVKVQEA